MTRRTLIRFAAAAPWALPAQTQPDGPSILLISGWNLYNIGDVAITPGFLRLAQKHFPRARVTLLAASYPRELTEYLQPFFPNLNVMPMEFGAGKPLSPKFEEAYRGADLVVLNSGMTLSYGYYGLEWERYIGRILAFIKARGMGIPYGVYGHSFDKVEPHADVLYRDVFATASFVYTRDTESLKLLQSKSVVCKEMGFGPDSTFGFDLRNQAKGEQFLQAYSLEPGKFLAFIPRLDVNRFREDGREKDHAEQTRAILARWVRETKLPVALVPEVQRQIEPAKQMVYDLMPADVRPHVRFKPGYWMPDEAQYVYSKAVAVASGEMHSVILGLAAGTPSVHFYFRQAGLKQWMMRDIGVPQWLLDQDQVSPEQIANALIGIQRDPAGARRWAETAMGYVRQRQTDTMAVVRRSAEEHWRKRLGARFPISKPGPVLAATS